MSNIHDDWDDPPLRPRGLDSTVSDWLWIATAAFLVLTMVGLLVVAGFER